MEGTPTVAVRRPQRWDEPLDKAMTDSDVAWLRSRDPFASMDPNSFPRSLPLDGILRYDCRMRRCEPGEIIVREGDYGNSAFLLIAGSVDVVVESLSAEQLGRTPAKKIGWSESLRRYLTRSNVPESRRATDVSANLKQRNLVRQVDDRQAVFLQDFDVVLRERETVTLGPGELFGEVAAMYRSPRTATVIAKTEATLLEIRWQGLRILRRDKKFADTLESHYRKHWLPVHLREIPLLRHVPDANLAKIAESTQVQSYGRMEWNSDYKKTRTLPVEEQIESEPLVAPEGRMPTELLIVRSGFGRLSQKHGDGHRTTAYIGKGHVFGLDEIACNALRPESESAQTLQSSLRAVGFLDVLSIPVETFATEILPHVRRSELPERAAAEMYNSDERRRERRRTGRRAKGQGDTKDDQVTKDGIQFDSTGMLEFIVQNRMNNGQQAMVIDLHRCTRCDDCVKACASAHDGNPKFVRHGVTYDRLQFVQACMHCADPVCMIGCPTGAISRNAESGVVSIHESICVGCGVCASACP
ncbi:MAG: cyclic nucleotide-binding domain-containing protein, partial [Rubripirellula sp.]